jgi:aconitate hydratase
VNTAGSDTFGTRTTLRVGDASYDIFSLRALEAGGYTEVPRLPVCLKILLENLLRHEDGSVVRRADIEALVRPELGTRADSEIAFTPSRVLLQDFTGVPAVVDLAAMRDAMARLGGDPARINPLLPVDLVIDHSVQVDRFGSPDAFAVNAELEMKRNRERYVFLRWGQTALANFRCVPPDTGIVHQVNLEYLAPVVCTRPMNGRMLAFPDSLVGTDSHTTMINALGVLGWGVGGIEAEAGMLGQPISMLTPDVVGVRLDGRLPAGATATDLVLTVTQMLRAHGVVAKFVEYFGDGLASLSLADRATIANMAPEYGATIGFFPVDDETLSYLRLTGRDDALVSLVETYCKEQGFFRTAGAQPAAYTETLTLDLGTIEPSLAGPRRPQDRVALREVRRSFRSFLAGHITANASVQDTEAVTRWVDEAPANPGAGPKQQALWETSVTVQTDSGPTEIRHGAVLISAITSCTNTSNPSVMLAAGLLAKKAVERGLTPKPWVKASLAPGSQVVTDYLNATGLTESLNALGFHLVGYGCTTCIGNSGPLPEGIAQGVRAHDLVAAAVLSGNRNFEGRINPLVRANYLASPPLVVAYALAGTVDIDLTSEPLGPGRDGSLVYLRDIWPSGEEVADAVRNGIRPEMFRSRYGDVFHGTDAWRALDAPTGDRYAWDPASTYIKHPPYFESLHAEPDPVRDIVNARVLVFVGDSVTTDHISPAGSIAADGPAGRYLQSLGVTPAEFNSYGARRGNHEVMVRGTFANIRLKNLLAPGTEGGWTTHFPSNERMSVFDAAERYRAEGVPLIVLAGREYGTGSSRDWAAKGPMLLGIRAAIATSFERIHRSNLVGMGILPLEFANGADATSLGLTGREVFTIEGLARGLAPRAQVTVCARAEDGTERRFQATVRIDTPQEIEYYRHGGILQYVLRRLSNRQEMAAT